MTITVTQEDIDNGTKGDCSHCPVAMAVARAFPKAFLVEVDTRGFEITLVDGLQCFTSHPSVALFITRFDRGFPVQPFTFELA